jgi:trimeric autotransporter adhesin
MSTKTTFKRIALVAVAALGLGLLSVAPSQADALTVSLTPSATTSAITTAETATITVTTSMVTALVTDSLTVNAVVTSANAATAGTLEFRGTTDSTTTRISSGGGTSITLDSPTASITGILVRGGVKLNLIKPTVKGTYTILVYTSSVGTGATKTKGVNDQSFTWTVTVTSDSTDATTATTSFIGAGTASAPTADAVVFGSKAALSTTKNQVATILVTQGNGTNTADEPLNVFVSGPGYIVAAADTITANTANKRSLQTTGASQKYILVFADGTAGPSTITIVGSVTGTILATEKLTFTDTKPAAVAVAVKKAYVAAGKATVKTFAVTVTDASGNAVTDAVITATRTDTTTAGKLLATGALTCGTYNTTDLVYYCASNGASTVVFGKAEYKFTATGIDADETAVSTTASTTYSDVVAKTATLTAPATASVGDKITYTLTLTDKNGYPVADTTYEGAFGNGDTSGQYGGIVWNTTTVPAYSSSVKPFNAGETITTVSGVATVDVYVPSVAGTITNTWVLAGKSTAAAGAIDASIGGTTLTTSTVVTNPGVDAATDAANEATDAANAATDAALAAADAADAATAAAQDASDAVAALSASVSKLISSLRAQITSLTNLVIKIQKKVRA